MNTHADKTSENKSRAVANRFPKVQSNGDSLFQFMDNRPESIAQRKLQEAINNGMIQRKVLFPNLEANNGVYPDSAIEIDSETYDSKPSNPFDDAIKLNGKYNFATVDGRIIAAAHAPVTPHHNDLAKDEDVDYAGTVTYGTDGIEEWDNHSGHYRPGVKWANQAKLPTGKFQPVGDQSPWDEGTEMVVKRHHRTYRRKNESSDWEEVKDDNIALSDSEEEKVGLIPTVKEESDGCMGGCTLF